MDIKNILQNLIFTLDGLSILVIVWGISIEFLQFIKSEIKSKNRHSAVKMVTTIKGFLGAYVLFGLEILIGADIIESILDPSINHIITLAVIVIIRTIISYFLSKEINLNEENTPSQNTSNINKKS